MRLSGGGLGGRRGWTRLASLALQEGYTGADDLFCGLMMDDMMVSFYDMKCEEIEAISFLGRSIAGSYIS